MIHIRWLKVQETQKRSELIYASEKSAYKRAHAVCSCNKLTASNWRDKFDLESIYQCCLLFGFSLFERATRSTESARLHSCSAPTLSDRPLWIWKTSYMTCGLAQIRNFYSLLMESARERETKIDFLINSEIVNLWVNVFDKTKCFKREATNNGVFCDIANGSQQKVRALRNL